MHVQSSAPTGTGKPVEDGTEQTANGYETFQTHSVEILPQTRKPIPQITRPISNYPPFPWFRTIIDIIYSRFTTHFPLNMHQNRDIIISDCYE